MSERTKLFPEYELTLTIKSLQQLEYNLMCERGADKGNSAGGLYRRMKRGKAKWAEVRLALICGLVGDGAPLAEADEQIRLHEEAGEDAGALWGVAFRLLAPFAGCEAA